MTQPIAPEGFGKWLREQRTARKLTQEEVGRAVGVTRVTVGDWEAGRAEPYPANRQALENLFAQSPSDATSRPSESPSSATRRVVEIDRDRAIEWRGQLKVGVMWMQSNTAMMQQVTALMQQIHDELGRATGVFADFVANGVLPAPSVVPPGWHMPQRPTREQIDEARRELDELETELAAQEQGGQQKRASGDDGAT